MDTQHFAVGAYSALLFALVFFVALSALLIFILNRELRLSLRREEKGAIYSRAVLLAQDEERARISRELHDTIIQDMRYLMLETEKTSGETAPMFASLIQKTRDMCYDLIPPDFRFSELPDALRQLCLDFGEKTGIDCRAAIDGDIRLEFLAMEKRLQVFRIVQEALANIEKHAGAKEAIVTMRHGQDGVVYVGISDNGKGFNSPLDGRGQIKTGIDKSRIGIVSMKERAAILGGRLKIKSEIGEGTLVCLEIHAKGARNGSAAG